MRIGGPNRCKQYSIWVDRHLDGIDHFGKHLFVCKKIDLHTVRHLHFGNRFLTVEILVLASFELAWDIGFHLDFWREIIVDHRVDASSRDGPHANVAISRHDIKYFHFTHHYVRVGLTKPS